MSFLFDFFIFFYIFHFFFYVDGSFVSFLFSKFFSFLKDVFSYNVSSYNSYIFSYCIFFFLLVSCFGGYFSYSFCFLGVVWFTFFFSISTWFSTFLFLISSQKFSVYFKKPGDGFFKTFFLLFVEIVSEFSRPIALSVRLFANIMVGHFISLAFYVFFECFYDFSFFIVFAIFFECFVFFLQSYIFSRLIYLYINE
uniref:ATP synthase subunit a n=1 Tax=Strongyloides sp. EN-2020c TaxID=2725241 RepID=A0A6J4CTU9_9BILA|nr:ATPase subunit 6 [Strongyloides sp. EN-2020c]BCD52158.1 ATPase subunit 6 [Strongyloides sp. EN-2020c]